MMVNQKWTLFWFVALLFAVCYGDEALHNSTSSSVVIELNADTFHSHIEKFKYTFVEFYAPWCGVCQKFAPEFEAAAATFQNYQILGNDSPVSVSFAKLNSWNETNAAVYKVSGYPTCVLFIDGVENYIYEDELTSTSIIEALSRKLRPDYVMLKSLNEVETVKHKDRLVVISFFENQESEDWRNFASMAKNNKQFLFASFIADDEVTKQQLNDLFQITEFPSTLVFKDYEDEVSKISNKELTQQLEQWIQSLQFPLVGEINKSNSKQYIHSRVPLLFIFVETEDQKTTLKSQLLPVAAETRLSLHFVFVNWTTYGTQAKKLALSGNVVPCLAIENTLTRRHYAFNESAEITEDNIRTWVNSYLDGTLVPSLKSQNVSLTNTSAAVIQLVGTNYVELVHQNPKDVFVFYSASWCRHCQASEPVWEEVASYVLKKNKKYGGVVFAKIDAEENDIPVANDSVIHYPTIRLFKAGDKSHAVTYTSNDRSAVALLQFVQDNASEPHMLKKIVKKYTKKVAKLEKKMKQKETKWQYDDDDDSAEEEMDDELHDYHDEL